MVQEEVMDNKTVNGEHLFENDKDYPAIIFITCMLSFFSVVGTTGNAFVLYVFSRKKDKNTSTIFILALASIDFVTCLFLIPFTIAMEFMYKRINNDGLCKVYQFFITSHVPFSAFIMVAIAFDRYFCICRPWMKFLDVLFAKKIIVCLLAFSMSLGLITSLAYGVYHRKTTVHNNMSLDQSNATLLVNVSESTATSNKLGERISVWQNCTVLSPESLVSRCYQNGDDESEKAEHYSTNISNNDFVFTGFCYPNEIILSKDFRRVYQTFYALLFLVAFVIVFVLYALIYRSLLVRRSKKLKSSLAYRNRHAKKSRGFLSYIFSRRRSAPETIRMESSEANLNNQITDSRLPASDACLDSLSTATCQTSLIGTNTPDSHLDGMARSTSYSGLAPPCKNISSEIIQEESENSSTGDASNILQITPNDLKPSNEFNKRQKRTTASKNGTNTKNTNTVRRNENGVVDHQDTYKVTTYNICRKDTRKSVREKNRLANIKTAGILFIVTVVFVIAFLPAWLMATKLIPPNMIVFYTYFIYNVANPIIYAFFNQAFQQEMKTVLKCTTRA